MKQVSNNETIHVVKCGPQYAVDVKTGKFPVGHVIVDVPEKEDIAVVRYPIRGGMCNIQYYPLKTTDVFGDARINYKWVALSELDDRDKLILACVSLGRKLWQSTDEFRSLVAETDLPKAEDATVIAIASELDRLYVRLEDGSTHELSLVTTIGITKGDVLHRIGERTIQIKETAQTKQPAQIKPPERPPYIPVVGISGDCLTVDWDGSRMIPIVVPRSVLNYGYKMTFAGIYIFEMSRPGVKEALERSTAITATVSSITSESSFVDKPLREMIVRLRDMVYEQVVLVNGNVVGLHRRGDVLEPHLVTEKDLSHMSIVTNVGGVFAVKFPKDDDGYRFCNDAGGREVAIDLDYSYWRNMDISSKIQPLLNKLAVDWQAEKASKVTR